LPEKPTAFPLASTYWTLESREPLLPVYSLSIMPMRVVTPLGSAIQALRPAATGAEVGVARTKRSAMPSARPVGPIAIGELLRN
jgi:hypothetical protein